jgi:uncharacterized protein (TIGR00288 family)
MNVTLVQKGLTLIISSVLSAIVLKDVPKAVVATGITSSVAVLCETVAKKQKPKLQAEQPEKPSLEPPNLAILWDLENVNVSKSSNTYSPIREILKLLENKGHPVVQRVYANWGKVSKSIAQEFAELGFDQVNTSNSKANELDWKLAIDCMTILKTHPEVKHIVLVSGDKDFLTLAHTCKQSNKQLTIIAWGSQTSKAFKESADLFIALESVLNQHQSQLNPLLSESTSSALISYEQALEYLFAAIQKAVQTNQTPYVTLMSHLMKQVSQGNFQNARSIAPVKGKKLKFTEFLKYAENQGLVQISTVNNQNVVLIKTAEISITPPPLIDSVDLEQELASSLPQPSVQTPEPISIEQALQYLLDAVGKAYQAGKMPSFPLIGLLMRQVSNGRFQGANYIVPIKGKRFTFTEFLQYAEQQGFVQISRMNGQNVVLLHSPESSANPSNTVVHLSDYVLQPENPKLTLSAIVSTEDWQKILTQLDQVFSAKTSADITDPKELGYMALLHHLRKLKSQGHINPYPVKVLNNVVNCLVAADLLILQENGRYQQTLNWADVFPTFVSELAQTEDTQDKAS